MLPSRQTFVARKGAYFICSFLYISYIILIVFAQNLVIIIIFNISVIAFNILTTYNRIKELNHKEVVL